MRQLEGRSLDIPVVTSLSPATIGADLSKLQDFTSTSQRVAPKTLGLYLELLGTGTVELVVNVRITVFPTEDLGWCQVVDTGNLGLVYGKALPSPGKYVALVSFAALYKEMILLAQNNVGGVSVNAAKLIEYAEYVRER